MVGQLSGVVVVVTTIGFTMYRLMIGFVPLVHATLKEFGWDSEIQG